METLAVKYRIQKFDCHLRGYQIEVHLENSSFPKLLEFKSKVLPNPQILKIKEWFSRYDFSVKHIKWTQSLTSDFLSRSNQIQTKPIIIFFSTHCYPLIMINTYSSTSPDEIKTQRVYPPDILPIIIFTPKCLQDFAKSHMFHYLATSLQQHNITPWPTWFDPTAPYLTILMGTPFIKSDIWYLWCVSLLYSYHILCPTFKLRQFLAELNNHNSLL